MRSVADLFGSALFFVPFAYVALYLWLMRKAAHEPLVHGALKILTVLAGFALLGGAFVAPVDLAVPVPSGGTARNSIPAPIFFAVTGIALLALPWYGRRLVFSRKD